MVDISNRDAVALDEGSKFVGPTSYSFPSKCNCKIRTRTLVAHHLIKLVQTGGRGPPEVMYILLNISLK